MIFKSYLIEQEINKLNKKINLIYGENLGLINELKRLIKEFSKNIKIIRFNEEEILKNNKILLRELSNNSLFEEEKIIFIDQASDKIIGLIQEAEETQFDARIYLFAGVLDKKSKLRNYLEISNSYFVVPCYEDNETTLRKIVLTVLKDFKGVTSQNVNMIIENCSLDRAKLNNELEKILHLFNNKVLDSEKLEKLLNIKSNDNFDKLRDAAFLGNRKNTNKLLSDTILEKEKNILYLNSINKRLGKLLEVHNNHSNIEKAVSNLKPPVFWKDKPNLISQAKVWNQKKIKLMMRDTYNLEIKIKSNSSIDKHILIKKLLIDMCELANAS